jgi:2-C-methyl-D-erythritol 4-phosphate cytidylyltransferase
MISAIILMGGRGNRFGSPTPKQFHRLGTQNIYQHTLKTFQNSNLFHEIILVCHPHWMVEEDGVKVVSGGNTRQQSTFFGLQACHPTTRYVVIHDAIRPFVTPKLLQAHVEHVQQHEAVSSCLPSTDTLMHAPDGKKTLQILNRSEYFKAQTPQSFSYELILDAHKKTEHRNASDDCSLILEMGYEIFLLPGSEENIKITTETDLLFAECLLSKQAKLNDSESSFTSVNLEKS